MGPALPTPREVGRKRLDSASRREAGRDDRHLSLSREGERGRQAAPLEPALV